MTALAPELLALLACPACRGGLAESGDALTCVKCGKVFAVVDGIPRLVLEG